MLLPEQSWADRVPSADIVFTAENARKQPMSYFNRNRILVPEILRPEACAPLFASWFEYT
jgi:hypothetical protein